MRVGIVSDFPSLTVQSGPAIHTRFLHDGLRKRGHELLLMGPDTGSVASLNGTQSHLYPSFGYPTHPNVMVSMPGSPRRLYGDAPKLDVIHGQTNSHMVNYAIWLRKYQQTALLNTHIIHLPTHSHFLLSDKLYANDMVREWLHGQAENMERSVAQGLYNNGDCLIVQSRHFVSYWRDRGVTCPIEVVGRPINPATFSRQPGADPFPASFKVGKRLVVVCRHDREKNLRQLIRAFASHVAPSDPEATLTLVGDGHDHANLAEYAMSTCYADRIYFSGETKHEDLVDWYAHADLFVYTSLSETFGNVVNEALWSGLPCVVLDDKMGVSGQVVDDVNGVVIQPNLPETEGHFGRACVALLNNRDRRRSMGEAAANLSRRTAHPDVVLSRFEEIYGAAVEHVKSQIPVPLKEQGRLKAMRAFAHHYAQWGIWSAILLGSAHAATRLGASRTSGATQHQAVEKIIRERIVEQRHEAMARPAA